MKKKTKVFSFLSIIIIVALAIFIYIHYFFVFGEGVKAGQLNFVVRKGYVFKTYEGMLIQSGFKSKGTTGTIQSYEFPFSVANKKVAEMMMQNSGENMQLYYREFFAPLIWRGMQKYVVYKAEITEKDAVAEKTEVINNENIE